MLANGRIRHIRRIMALHSHCSYPEAKVFSVCFYFRTWMASWLTWATVSSWSAMATSTCTLKLHPDQNVSGMFLSFIAFLLTFFFQNKISYSVGLNLLCLSHVFQFVAVKSVSTVCSHPINSRMKVFSEKFACLPPFCKRLSEETEIFMKQMEKVSWTFPVNSLTPGRFELNEINK